MDIFLFLLTVFGGVAMAAEGVKLTVYLAPRLLTVRSKAWRLLADTFTIRALRRQAIATGIEAVLNQTAFGLQRHLPAGWVRRVRIRWVRSSLSAEFHEGQIVLRIRPGKNPDQNFIQSLYTYFHTALFPDSRDILPDAVVSAIALAITRASLEGSHQYLLKEFDGVFLKTLGESKQDILDRFGDCVRLNEYGFLMGPFVREVDRAAEEARFSSNRARIPEMVQQILAHMLEFQVRINLPDDAWFYNGPCTSFGFTLVSKPPIFRPAIEAYVRRAQSMVHKGIRRLYVIGRHEERDFMSSVIKALLNIRELKSIELFPLFRDYRGDANGLGALLGVDEMLEKLNLTLRPLDRMQIQPVVTSPSQNLESADESQGLATVADAQLDLAKIAEDLIIQLSDYDGEWIPLAHFGSELRKQVPAFTPQRYGGRNLISVLRNLDSLEFDERGAGPAKAVYVRLRAGNHRPIKQVTSVGEEGYANRGSDRPAEQVTLLSEAEAYARIAEIIGNNAASGGWLFLAQLGNLLKRQLPEFDHNHFEAGSLYGFLRRIPALEFEERGDGGFYKQVYVRVRL